MRAELYRHDDPGTTVAVATWSDGIADIEPTGPAVEGLDTIFRSIPVVVVEDASLRRQGTHGEVLLQPGSLEWFRAALLVRAEVLGLEVRFVAGEIRGGWDPAAQYRTFGEQVGRLSS